jgi:predicted adenylyl cyclase CyaB
MRRNIEIKARILDWQSANRAALAVADGPPQILEQEDVFFATERGRLKLRTVNGEAELIYYHRPDGTGPRQSDYLVLPIIEPRIAVQMLEMLHARRGTVRKKRWLYLSGQTRIHLDRVEDLGDFLELETVLLEDQSAADGERVLRDLMARLGIAHEHLIDRAYIDLLADRRPGAL